MKIIKKIKRKLKGEADIDELIRCGMNVGTGCWFGEHCSFDWSFPWLISIGNNVTFSHGVDLVAHDASAQKCLRVTRLSKITIGDNVFIGANSTVLPGVEIGENSIVGAMTLVNKNIPPNEVWGGVPARFICSIDEYIDKHGKFDQIMDAAGIMHKCDSNKQSIKNDVLNLIDQKGEVYIK